MLSAIKAMPSTVRPVRIGVRIKHCSAVADSAVIGIPFHRSSRHYIAYSLPRSQVVLNCSNLDPISPRYIARKGEDR